MRVEIAHFPAGKVSIFSTLYINIFNKHFIVYHLMKDDTQVHFLYQLLSFIKNEAFFNLVHRRFQYKNSDVLGYNLSKNDIPVCF